MILAGDIGGTKTLLAVLDVDGRCLGRREYRSGDFNRFDDLLQAFLRQEGIRDLERVCLGVAGPIVDGDCVATNLPWILKRRVIAELTGTKQVYLLNDLEAMAWGVLSSPAEEFVELNPEAKTKSGNIAVLAAGTGLGEAILCWNGEGYHVMSTEGGHADFAPADELEIELLRYLRHKYSGHVSYERLVSGMGVRNIYQFLKDTGYQPVNTETERMMREQDAGAVISMMARQGDDELCIKTMQLFCAIYGAEAGNMVLKTLSYGGVVLAGGIAIKNLSLLRQGGFWQRFLDKGRYRQMMQEISVKVCVNPQLALSGAAEFAARRNG